MADDLQKENAESSQRSEHPQQQDPLVERLKPNPAGPAVPSRTMVGFFGYSDRPRYSRLYFTRDLNYYAEFQTDQILYTEMIPPEQAPFRGDQATRVVLQRTAEIAYTHVRSSQPVDEFDIDLKLRRQRASRTGAFGMANLAETEENSMCGCGTEAIDTCPTTVTQCQTLCETQCVTGCLEMCQDTGGQFTCLPTCGVNRTCPAVCPVPFDPPPGPSVIPSACVGVC